MSYIRASSSSEGIYIIHHADDGIVEIIKDETVRIVHTVDFNGCLIRGILAGCIDEEESGVYQHGTLTVREYCKGRADDEDNPRPSIAGYTFDNIGWDMPLHVSEATALYMAYELLHQFDNYSPYARAHWLMECKQI